MYHLISGYPGLREPYKGVDIKQSLKAMAINHFLFSEHFNRKHVRKIFPTRNLLFYDSVRHIFISLIIFIWIPNSMRIFYKP
jgi:hypothetical protein